MKKDSKLPQLPERTLAILDRHRDDEDFWSLERQSGGTRTITEIDKSGKIVSRVKAFVTADQHGTVYYAFAYEEWQYFDRLRMAVMKRERMDGNEYTVRTYGYGAVIDEITATIYGDRRRVIKFVQPMAQPDKSVIYATATYHHFDTLARPSHLIELGSHYGEGKPVGLYDYHIEVTRPQYRRGVFNLKKQFDNLGIIRAGTSWNEDGERPGVTIERDAFVIDSSLGRISFPIELNFNQLFTELRF